MFTLNKQEWCRIKKDYGLVVVLKKHVRGEKKFN